MAKYRKTKKLNSGMKKAVKKEIQNALSNVQEVKTSWYQLFNRQDVKNVANSKIGLLDGCQGFITDLGAPGPTYFERTGDQILLKNLQLRYTVNSSSDGILIGADEYNNVRIIVFQWHADTTIDRPDSGKILEGTVLSAEHKYLGFYNSEYKDKYTILYDQTHVVFNTPIYNGSAVKWEEGPNGVVTKHVNISLKRCRKHINFISDDDSTDHICILAISDSTADPYPKLSLAYEFKFTDS